MVGESCKVDLKQFEGHYFYEYLSIHYKEVLDSV